MVIIETIVHVATEEEVEQLLAAPSADDVAAAAALEGDIVVLGAAGKMGPSLVRRARNALEAAGKSSTVYAVARFTDASVKDQLAREGVRVITADLLERKQVDALPDAPNIIFMAGRKFGSTGNEPLTWAVNTWAPAVVAERYKDSRIVAFSTGNVYPFVPVASGGATEATPTVPVGEYAQTGLGRERLFQYFSDRYGTPVCILRLNYAVEFRYGVLVDIGWKVYQGAPIDLAMGYVNVIWQGDANSVALRAFPLASSPARILNLTGPETLPVRDIALAFGKEFGKEPEFTGQEAETALLNNAALCHKLLGKPSVTPGQMIVWIADWIRSGGVLWNKPTHFEARDGKF